MLAAAGSTAAEGGCSVTKRRAEALRQPADFSETVRGLHHIPLGAKVLLPASVEPSVWEYFSTRAEQKGVGLSELLTDVVKRDIEINEALR